LYAEILERIESVDYDVFTRRVRVPGWRKILVVAQSVRASRGG
jgi:phytoene/squalene synthetase